MPWSIEPDHPDCGDGQYAVVNDVSGEVEGCHESMDAAKSQQAALYAAEEDKPMASARPRLPTRGLRDLIVVRGTAAGLALRDPARAAIPSHHTGVDDSTAWDKSPNMKRLPNTRAALRAMHAWVDPDGDPEAKDSYKIPHHNVSESGAVGAANASGVRNGLSRLPQSDVPAGDQDGVRRHLQAHLDDAAGENDSARRRPPLAVESVETFDPELEPEVMTVRFSVFDTWYPVDSFFEGTFLERTQRGAFAKTITERGNTVKVLFNHGFDVTLGDQVLGVPSLLEERDDSAYGEVPLLAGIPPLILSGLRAGAYGASFTFQVLRDEWNDHPNRSDHNPDRLPERTITEVRLMEFGPVTWPANPAATAAVRSLTDRYYADMRRREPRLVETLTRRVQSLRTSDADAAPHGTSAKDAANPTDAPDGPAVHPSGLSPHARTRVLAHPFLSHREQTHDPHRAAHRD